MPEIVTCPECKRQLQVPEAFFGKNVQCPECKQTFKANPPGPAPAPVATASATPEVPPWEKPPPRALARTDDDRPRKRRSSRRDDDEDEDDDEDDRPRKRRRRLADHRGGMILAFGIIGLVGVIPLIFGPMAWFMGNADLREMRAGRMDPSGEAQTNTGRILGMVTTILTALVLVGTCAFILFLMFMGIVAGGRH